MKGYLPTPEELSKFIFWDEENNHYLWSYTDPSRTGVIMGQRAGAIDTGRISINGHRHTSSAWQCYAKHGIFPVPQTPVERAVNKLVRLLMKNEHLAGPVIKELMNKSPVWADSIKEHSSCSTQSVKVPANHKANYGEGGALSPPTFK